MKADKGHQSDKGHSSEFHSSQGNHTPGPWYLARNGAGSVVCSKAAPLLPLSSGVRCLDVVARTDWDRGEEDEANARLIAAAPELLEALTAVCRSADAMNWQSQSFDDARKLLAKAKP